MSTLSIRLPDSLHERLKQMAEKEGVSMNQFIALALSEKISALHTLDYLKERAARGEAPGVRSHSVQGAGCGAGRAGQVLGFTPDLLPPAGANPGFQFTLRKLMYWTKHPCHTNHAGGGASTCKRSLHGKVSVWSSFAEFHQGAAKPPVCNEVASAKKIFSGTGSLQLHTGAPHTRF